MSFSAKLQHLLDSRNIPYHSGKQSFITDCLHPTCGKEGHFYIRKRDGRSICFKCGFKANWQKVVSLICRCDQRQSWEVLFGFGGGEIDVGGLDLSVFSKEAEVIIPEEKSIILGPDFAPIEKSKRGIEYLISRGVTNAELIVFYDIRYHTLMDAVVFPIKKNEKIYGWQARKIAPQEGELRLISYSFNKSKYLLNWDRARLCRSIFMVEGPFDCIHCDVEDIGAVASLGKGVSLNQIKMILDSDCERIYVGLDSDAALEVEEIVSRFYLKKQVYRPICPSYRKDFGDCNKDEVENAIKNAVRKESRTDFIEVYFKQ